MDKACFNVVSKELKYPQQNLQLLSNKTSLFWARSLEKFQGYSFSNKYKTNENENFNVNSAIMTWDTEVQPSSLAANYMSKKKVKETVQCCNQT